LGYNDGFYKVEQESECLNNATTEKMIHVIEVIEATGPSVSVLLSIAPDLFAIVKNL
jgi:hypothetical protein